MIRLFSIFDKLNHIHFSDRQWFELESGARLACEQSCPSCGARGCLRPFAHYTRYLVEVQENRPVVYNVTVQRFCCDSCGHTHAAHPACLVPYRSYSLRFILFVLRAYFLHLQTVERICEIFGIAASTLYCWKALFLNQKALWLGVLTDTEQMAAGFLDGLSGKGSYSFLEKYGFSFLEAMPGRALELPSCIPRNSSAVT